MEQEPDGEMLAVDLAQFLADRDRLPEALEVIDEEIDWWQFGPGGSVIYEPKKLSAGEVLAAMNGRNETRG